MQPDLLVSFEARLARNLKASRLFPYHAWVATLDPSTPPECRALDGKTWRVESADLRRVAQEHFGKALPGCRCMGIAVREGRL